MGRRRAVGPYQTEVPDVSGAWIRVATRWAAALWLLLLVWVIVTVSAAQAAERPGVHELRPDPAEVHAEIRASIEEARPDLHPPQPPPGGAVPTAPATEAPRATPTTPAPRTTGSAPSPAPPPRPSPAPSAGGAPTGSGDGARSSSAVQDGIAERAARVQSQADARAREIEARGAAVEERATSVGGGKIVICKIAAGTRGDGSGLCDGRPDSTLAGAGFEVRTDDGAVAGRCTSRLDGACIVYGLPFGTYRIVETMAPSGFVLDASPRTVQVTQTDIRPKLFVENHPVGPGGISEEPGAPEEPSEEPVGEHPGEPGEEPHPPGPAEEPVEPPDVAPIVLVPPETQIPTEVAGVVLEADDDDAEADVEVLAAGALAVTGHGLTALLTLSLWLLAAGLLALRLQRVEDR